MKNVPIELLIIDELTWLLREYTDFYKYKLDDRLQKLVDQHKDASKYKVSADYLNVAKENFSQRAEFDCTDPSVLRIHEPEYGFNQKDLNIYFPMLGVQSSDKPFVTITRHNLVKAFIGNKIYKMQLTAVSGYLEASELTVEEKL